MDFLNNLKALKIQPHHLTIIATLFLYHSAMALTVSPAANYGVEIKNDPVNNMVTYTAITANANINNRNLENDLSTHNVKIEDKINPNIIISAGTVMSWRSSYNLIINAEQDIVIENQAKLINYNYGGLVLRADCSADKGTLIFPESGNPSIILSQGDVKIYYRPEDNTKPTDFSYGIQISYLARATAYMMIHNLLDLQNINRNLTGEYALTKNIDASGTLFTPLGTREIPFAGGFDGQGYRISNLTIDSQKDFVGLFGYANASIENVGLLNAHVTGGRVVGGLVGDMIFGGVRNSFVSGDVSGTSAIGGLMGWYSYGTSFIEDSFTEGTVNLLGQSNSAYCGGLVGDISSVTIRDSYSTSKVSGLSSSRIGGLIGYNDNRAILIRSYAAGLVAPVIIQAGFQALVRC